MPAVGGDLLLPRVAQDHRLELLLAVQLAADHGAGSSPTRQMASRMGMGMGSVLVLVLVGTVVLPGGIRQAENKCHRKLLIYMLFLSPWRLLSSREDSNDIGLSAALGLV